MAGAELGFRKSAPARTHLEPFPHSCSGHITFWTFYSGCPTGAGPHAAGALQTSTPTRAHRQGRVSAPSPCHTPLPREVTSDSGRGSSRRPSWYPPPGRRGAPPPASPSPSPLAPHPARPVTHQPHRRAAFSAASRPGQPKGRRGPGGRFRHRRRLSSAQPHHPRPAPAAAGRSGSRVRRRASRLGLWEQRRRGGARAAPGAGASALRCRRLRRRRRAAGQGENKGARLGRPTGEEGRSARRSGLPPSATKRTPSPRPRRPVTLRGGPAGTRGAPRELRTPAPDVRSRDCLIPAPSAEGPSGGGATLRSRPLRRLRAPSPPKQELLAGCCCTGLILLEAVNSVWPAVQGDRSPDPPFSKQRH